jgi:hypothetical protein
MAGEAYEEERISLQGGELDQIHPEWRAAAWRHDVQPVSGHHVDRQADDAPPQAVFEPFDHGRPLR